MQGRQNQARRQYTLKERLVAELKADKKKAALLGVLGLVALVLVVRLVFSGSPGTTSAAVAVRPDKEPMAKIDGPIRPLTIKNAPASTRRRNEYLAKMDRAIQRDIFAPDPTFFPPEKGSQEEEPIRRKQTPEELRQQRREAIRKQAEALHLQSTIVGTSPIAVINGKLLHKGDWMAGFQVTEVKPRSCVVKKDDVSVELKME
ncbi:MAG: hypothetical protein ACLFV7_10925 [Phycisphaerae bacterium]